MDDAEFKARIEGLTEQRDCACRQVANGYLLTSNTRYIQPVTGAIMVSRATEAVASSASEAGTYMNTYMTTGEF